MSDLNDVVQISISRETQSIAQASFGVFGIITEFETSKTTAAFARHRFYSKLSELTDDGWGAYDPIYRAAQKVFSQNPKIERILVGRKDSADAAWLNALAAIKNASDNWYMFDIVEGTQSNVVVSEDFVTANSIVFTINGTAVTAVPFNTNQQTTMTDLKTQIEADITGSAVVVGADPYRTMIITITNDGMKEHVVVTAVVTSGASQPVITAAEATLMVDQDIKDVAAWTETEKKIYAYNSSASGIKDPASEVDIAYFLKAQNYDRVFGFYYKDSDLSYIEPAMAGEALPYDPGSQTWCYKKLVGVASYQLTSSERTAVLAKNANIYTSIAGVNVSEEGKVASGEYIDIMRGLDWLEARLQENIFSQLVNIRKIPFTDEGITLVAGLVQEVLEEAAGKGILVKESIVLTVPKAADVSSADKLNRLLPDINFTATLQGAIHKTKINGIVTI